MRSLFTFLLPLACSFEPKLCITCKHFINAGNNRYAKCNRFPILVDTIEDILSGNIKTQYTDYNYCSTARTFGFMCGKKGKRYEKIELFTDTEEKKDNNEPTRRCFTNY